MKITAVTATWLHVPIPEDRQHVSDFGRVTSFDATLVRIDTDAGITGWGEAKAAVGSASVNHGLSAIIEKELGPLLIGEDPRDINRLWEVMYNGVRAHYAIERGRAFPILGRRGLTICGIAGIDIALWDILGKSLDQPVWRLLGGRMRERMPAYASGGWAPAESIADQLGGYIAKGGFGAVKMRVGAGDGDVRTSIRRVKAAREGLGDAVDIMCDSHGTMSLSEAKRFCREVADCRIAWFEEPILVDDHDGMAELRRFTDIPISAGESEFTRFDFLSLARKGAVDIFQPDLAICGGLTEAQRIAAIASSHQIRLAPHLWSGALAFSAGLHLAASSNAGFILEYSLGANPMLHELAVEDFVVEDGTLAIPDRPGLGVTVDEDFVDRYRVET